MYREASLPSEFDPISERVNFIQRHSSNEYSSSCPECGGSIHPDGEWPDRFVVMLNSKATGGAFAWCRHCGFKWWPGKEQGEEITPEMRERWRHEAAERQKLAHEASERRLKQVLEMLETDRLWEQYYENVNAETRKFFEERGISEEWRAVWQLGINPAFSFWKREEEKIVQYQSPSITIPIFKPGESIPHNIHNRILNPPTPRDRYRVQFKDIEPFPFLALPELGFGTEKIAIVEGEFKSMSVMMALDDPSFQVIGVSGKNSWAAIVEHLIGREPWIILDPDAKDQAILMAKQVGGGRVVSFPMKVDDALNAGHLSRAGLLSQMYNSRRYK